MDAFLENAIALDIKKQIVAHESELAKAKKSEEEKNDITKSDNPNLGFGDPTTKWYFYNL